MLTEATFWREPALDGLPDARLGREARLRAPTIIYPGVVVGDFFSSGHFVTIRERTRIGNHCSVGTSSILERDVVLHDHVRLHSRVFVPEYTVIHSQAWIGPGVVITNAKYPSSPHTKANLRGVTIGARAKVGAAAVLLPGVILGEDCLVGAGSVVTRAVPAGAVVVGNPARVIGETSDKKFADGALAYAASEYGDGS